MGRLSPTVPYSVPAAAAGSGGGTANTVTASTPVNPDVLDKNPDARMSVSRRRKEPKPPPRPALLEPRARLVQPARPPVPPAIPPELRPRNRKRPTPPQTDPAAPPQNHSGKPAKVSKKKTPKKSDSTKKSKKSNDSTSKQDSTKQPSTPPDASKQPDAQTPVKQ